MENEKRLLIAFDDVVNALAKEYGNHMDSYVFSPREILESIGDISPVDAVEVVRCKDCKKHGVGNRCNMWKIPHYTMPDDFCSYGERKSGE